MNLPTTESPSASIAAAPARALLALAALALLSWPLLSIAGERGLFALLRYVFVVWAALVIALAVVGRRIARDAAAGDNAAGGTEPPP